MTSPSGGPVQATVFRGGGAVGDAFAGGNPTLDDLGELALFLGVEQRNGADLIEVLTNGIAHDDLSNNFGAVTIPAEATSEKCIRQVSSR